MDPGVNILLVDDEPRNLEVLETILAAPDLRLVPTANADEALLALVNQEFACIILDVQMPNMSGLDLARLIKTRRRNQHIPIIFLTGYFLDEKDILQGYGAGAVDYLTKPINPRILKSKVGVFVDLFRTTRALTAANRALEAEMAQRIKAEELSRQINNELEIRVRERTAELSLTERRYRQVVYNSPAAIYTTDAEGRVTLYNEAAAALWGQEPKIGKELYCGACKIFRPDGTELPPDQCPSAVTLKNGNGVRGEEIVIERPDGTRRNILVYPEAFCDASGKLAGAVNVLVDITERQHAEMVLKKAHQEVLAASRAKDEFLATLSHELRTPLNPVLLIASDAANNQELSPRVRTDFDTIRKNIELEARLIDDLLDLTRIARGKIILDRRYLAVHSVLHDAIAQERDKLTQKRITLHLRLDAARQTVYADPVRLQQIFWNLLNNAVKFTPAGGNITVETAVSESKLVVKITDSGIGMTPEEVGRVFSAFAQGSQVAVENGRRFGGLGLGLAISQKLAELHYGKMNASSLGRDQGAAFTVEFPLAEAPAKAGEETPGYPPPSAWKPPAKNSGVRILLVEDHEPTRSSLARLLMHRYYEVISAASIAEARALVADKEFHLLISDIGLPDGSGYDLMMELRRTRRVRGIALTGYGMEQDVARSQHAGFVAHLTKPVGIQSLEVALAAAL